MGKKSVKIDYNKRKIMIKTAFSSKHHSPAGPSLDPRLMWTQEKIFKQKMKLKHQRTPVRMNK